MKLEPRFPPATLRRVRRDRAWKATAYHEAGHAVIRLVLGYAVRAVRLTPDRGDEQHGCCDYSFPAGKNPREWTDRRLRAEIGTWLAGEAAEILFMGAVDPRGARRDYQLAIEAELHAEADGLVEEMEQAVVRLVREHREAIRRVADALLACDTLSLSGKQVKTIMAAS